MMITLYVRVLILYQAGNATTQAHAPMPWAELPG